MQQKLVRSDARLTYLVFLRLFTEDTSGLLRNEAVQGLLFITCIYN